MNWPSRKEAVRLTTIVVAMSVALAAFLGAFDMLTEYALKYFLQV